MKFYFLFTLTFFSFILSQVQGNSLPSNPLDYCPKTIEGTPIQTGGRVKPLMVHANEVLQFFTEKKKYKNLTATQTYCLLGLKFLIPSMDLKILNGFKTPIHHQDVIEFLNLQNQPEKSMTLQDLVHKRSDLQMKWQSIKEDNAVKKEVNKLLSKINLYEDIISGENWNLYLGTAGNNQIWKGLSHLKNQFSGQIITPTAFVHKISSAQNLYHLQQNKDYKLEETYVKLRFVFWAQIVTLLAIVLLTLRQKVTVALILTYLSFGLQLAAMIFRILISGRAPITNMYETVSFSGFAALILAIILTSIKKEKIFLLVGLSYNFLCLLMMNFANNMLDSSISPLVPVLRDNFWLSTHVTCVILSYSAFALSWMLSNITLIKKRFFSLSQEEFMKSCQLVYTCVKIGVVLLAGGIILGGVWADYSWGRFWGWDPKETWSLIALCLYMIILHGRLTVWISWNTFLPLVALGFLGIMMAWFGVNYILAAGLHSYGFSEGGAVFLGSFFLVQIALLLLTTFPRNRKGIPRSV